MDLFKRLKQKLRKKKQPQPVDVLTGYRHWAQNYPAEAHNPLMVVEEQAMVSLLPDLTHKTCLDLACGSGRYIRLLERRRARQVFGLDYSAHMLTQARQAGPELKLVRSPFLALPFADATFDLITCGLGVGHEKDLDHALQEAARLLRPEGAIIYSDFHPFAALSGGQRSFTTDNGVVYNLEHYIHRFSDHVRACEAAGLTLTAVLEPAAAAKGSPQFEQMPVALIIRAVKHDQ